MLREVWINRLPPIPSWDVVVSNCITHYARSDNPDVLYLCGLEKAAQNPPDTLAYLIRRRMVCRSANLGSNWGESTNLVLRALLDGKFNGVAVELAKWKDRLGSELLRIERDRVIAHFRKVWGGRE